MFYTLKKTTLWLLCGAIVVFMGSANSVAQGVSTSPIPDSSEEIAALYFADTNKKSLSVIYNNNTIGRVEIYKHLGITLLPVGKLAPMLGIPITVDADNGTAEGKRQDGKKVMLIPAKNTALVGGQEKKQIPGLMFMRDREIYVNSSVFVDVFSLSVYVNYTANTLRVSKEEEETPEVAPAPKTPPAPATNTPTPSVVPAPETAPAPVKAPVPAAPVPPAPSHAAPIETGTEESLVMQLIIDDITMEDFVEGFRKGDKLYLPIGQLTSIVDFAITTDPVAKTAKGWFIREENTFALTTSSVSIKGETTALPPESVIAKDQDLFVDADLLQHWFPLDFLMDRYNMTLLLNAREKLPFEEKIMRQKNRDSLAQKIPPKEVTYKTIDYPYEAATAPFINMTFSPSYQSQGAVKRGGYTIIATGDLAYMTGHLYAGGDLNDDPLSDLRMVLGQDDYSRGLLGPLHASSFELGDINSVGLSQVAQASGGRGFMVSNRAAGRSDKFDVTSFIGDSTPGWEVELYRNGTLISSQVVGSDGRYNFSDIPILYGNNTFRLVFFGPQGQVDEIVKNINASSSLLEDGEFTYNISADQEGRTIFNVDEVNSQNAGRRAVGEFEYGVTRWLTATMGAAHTTLDNVGHNYVTGGLRTSVGSALLDLDTAYDTNNSAYSTKFSAFANYFDTNFHVQQKFASNFISEEGGITNDPINRLSEIGFDRQDNLPMIGDLSAGLTYTRKQYESGRVDNLWLNRISTPIFGINFTNSLQYEYDNQTLRNLTGGLSLRGFYDRVLLGGQLDYTIQPVRQLSDLKLTGSYPIDNGVSGNTSLLKNFQGDRHSEFEDTVTLDMQKYRISFTGRADTNNNYFLGAALNMSFGKLPESDKWMFSSRNMAEAGTIIVRPFVDLNYNQEQDEGEEVPSNTSFKIGSQSVARNEDGEIVATALPTNQPVSVRMDADKQENPFWTTGVDEYRVAPRPGTPVVVAYPLFETSQIDGTVKVVSGSVNGLKVELVNTEGQVIAGARTAFDGYYLLQGVMPGAYTVRVAEEDLIKRKLKQQSEASVTVKTADFFTKDITLIPAGQESATSSENTLPPESQPVPAQDEVQP